jgi:hypothetical protein
VQPLRRKWLETVNNWNFSKPKGYNSVKYCKIVPKTELDLDILMINLYTKYHFSICHLCKENERKLQRIEIFLSPRAITLSKMARSYQKQIVMINLHTKYHFNMCSQCEENKLKLEIIGIFLSPRAITLSKMARSYPKITWPRYAYDKSVYQISFQYVQPVRRKWTETANYWIFSKPKGHNSVTNGSIVPK